MTHDSLNFEGYWSLQRKLWPQMPNMFAPIVQSILASCLLKMGAHPYLYTANGFILDVTSPQYDGKTAALHETAL